MEAEVRERETRRCYVAGLEDKEAMSQEKLRESKEMYPPPKATRKVAANTLILGLLTSRNRR